MVNIVTLNCVLTILIYHFIQGFFPFWGGGGFVVFCFVFSTRLRKGVVVDGYRNVWSLAVLKIMMRRLLYPSYV